MVQFPSFRPSPLPEDDRGTGFTAFGSVDLKKCLEKANVADLSGVKILKRTTGDTVSYEIGKRSLSTLFNRKIKTVDSLDLFLVRHADSGSISQLSKDELMQLRAIAVGVQKSGFHLFSKRVEYATEVIRMCNEALKEPQTRVAQPLEGLHVHNVFLEILEREKALEGKDVPEKREAYSQMLKDLTDYIQAHQDVARALVATLSESAIKGMYAVHSGTYASPSGKDLRAFKGQLALGTLTRGDGAG